MTFRSRFADNTVRFQAADQFTAHPDNPKFHPPLQREVIKALLGSIGWIDAVKVSKRTGYVLDGHERIFTALENGDSEPVPFLLVDVSEDEEKEILATYDPSGYLAQHDAAQLDALLQQVNSDSPAVQRMLAELAVAAKVIPPNDPYAEWTGMPEFEQDNLEAYHSIKVHFKTLADMNDFSSLIHQGITEKTVFIYHPKQYAENLKPYQVHDES
jgi:hypothetical protein